jgi:hypothetical protein
MQVARRARTSFSSSGRHSASHTSRSEVAPLNKVRMTRSHFTSPSRSRSVKASFRSSSPRPNNVSLTLFCAPACNEISAQKTVVNNKRIISSWSEPIRCSHICGAGVGSVRDPGIGKCAASGKEAARATLPRHRRRSAPSSVVSSARADPDSSEGPRGVLTLLGA